MIQGMWQMLNNDEDGQWIVGCALRQVIKELQRWYLTHILSNMFANTSIHSSQYSDHKRVVNINKINKHSKLEMVTFMTRRYQFS